MTSLTSCPYVLPPILGRVRSHMKKREHTPGETKGVTKLGDTFGIHQCHEFRYICYILDHTPPPFTDKDQRGVDKVTDPSHMTP